MGVNIYIYIYMYIYIYISHAQVCVCAGRLHVPSVLPQLLLQCCQRKSCFQAARHNWKELPVKTSVVDGGEKPVPYASCCV